MRYSPQSQTTLSLQPLFADYTCFQWDFSEFGKGFAIQSVYSKEYLSFNPQDSTAAAFVSPYPVAWQVDIVEVGTPYNLIRCVVLRNASP